MVRDMKAIVERTAYIVGNQSPLYFIWDRIAYDCGGSMRDEAWDMRIGPQQVTLNDTSGQIRAELVTAMSELMTSDNRWVREGAELGLWRLDQPRDRQALERFLGLHRGEEA